MYSDEDVIERLRESFTGSTATLAADPGLPEVIRGRLRRRRRSQAGLTAASAVAIAGVVASALLAGGGAAKGRAPAAQGPTGAVPSARSATSSNPAVTGPTTSAPLQLASVSEVLDAAALAHNPVVGPGQYLHTHSRSYDFTEAEGRGTIDMFTTSTNDNWTPGGADGLSLACLSTDAVTFLKPSDREFLERNAPAGSVPPLGVQWQASRSDGSAYEIYPEFMVLPGNSTIALPSDEAWEDPLQAASLPRDPTAMRTSLYSYATAQAAEARQYKKAYSADEAAFDTVAAALAWPTATEDLRAALYQVAKTIPGIRLIGSMTNFNGVTGVGIGQVQPSTGLERDLIFDAHTGEFIGDRLITSRRINSYSGLGDQPILPTGTVLWAHSYSVDVTGQPALPPGTKLP